MTDPTEITPRTAIGGIKAGSQLLVTAYAAAHPDKWAAVAGELAAGGRLRLCVDADHHTGEFIVSAWLITADKAVHRVFEESELGLN